MKKFNRITTDHLYDKISEIVTVAAPLFSMYGWTYGENRTPYNYELRDMVTKITQTALDSFYQSDEEFRSALVSSGRFIVDIREFEDEVSVRYSLNLGEKSWFRAL